MKTKNKPTELLFDEIFISHDVIDFGNFLRDNYYGVGAPKLISYDQKKYPHGTVENIFRIWLEEKKLSNNSLALGKPELLEKNKQTQEVKCNNCNDKQKILLTHVHGDYQDTLIDCPHCTNRADATSR